MRDLLLCYLEQQPIRDGLARMLIDQLVALPEHPLQTQAKRDDEVG